MEHGSGGSGGNKGVSTDSPIAVRPPGQPRGQSACQSAQTSLATYAAACLSTIVTSGVSGVSVEPSDYANATYITQQCTSSCLSNVTHQLAAANTACNTSTATTVLNTYEALGARVDLLYRYYNVLCAQSTPGTYDVVQLYQTLNGVKQATGVVIDGTLQSYEYTDSSGTVLGVTQYNTLSNILSSNVSVDTGILNGTWDMVCNSSVALPTAYNIIMLNELYLGFPTLDVYDDANRVYQACSTDPTTTHANSTRCATQLEEYFSNSSAVSASTFTRLCQPCLYRAYNDIQQWTVETEVISGSFQYAINDLCTHINNTQCTSTIYNVLSRVDSASALSGLTACTNTSCSSSCASALSTVVPVSQLGGCASVYIDLLALHTQETQPLAPTDIYSLLATCGINVNQSVAAPSQLLHLTLTLPNLDTALFDPAVLQDGGAAYLAIEDALTYDVSVLAATLPQNVVVLNLNLTTNYKTLTSNGATADVFLATDTSAQLQALQSSLQSTIQSDNFILPSVQSYTVGINLLQEQTASANGTANVVSYATYNNLLNAAVAASSA